MGVGGEQKEGKCQSWGERTEKSKQEKGNRKQKGCERKRRGEKINEKIRKEGIILMKFEFI